MGQCMTGPSGVNQAWGECVANPQMWGKWQKGVGGPEPILLHWATAEGPGSGGWSHHWVGGETEIHCLTSRQHNLTEVWFPWLLPTPP